MKANWSNKANLQSSIRKKKKVFHWIRDFKLEKNSVAIGISRHSKILVSLAAKTYF